MDNRRRPESLAGMRMALRMLVLLHWLVLPICSDALAAESSDHAASAAEQDRLAMAVRAGGVVVLIRHSATDPGVGDPPGFTLDNCSSQRNLSDAGRAQAGRIGRWFRQHAIDPTVVRASPWCRTRETAMLAFGRSQDWAPLSNLLSDRSRQDEHARQVRDAIAGVGPKDVAVLVSHGVTINAFIDEYLRQGELVVVRPARRPAGPDQESGSATAGHAEGRIEVVGRLLVP